MNSSETPSETRILVVDDERFYIDVLVDLLHDDYKVVVAMNGEQALKRAKSITPPDLILLDVLMPGMDGYEVSRQLKKDPSTCDIPVIFLTVKSEVDDEIRGFQLGASDYITKPMSPPIVQARVRNHLALIQAHKALQDQNQALERRVRERTREIEQTQDIAIYCMASLAETRDNETGNHIRRTQHYVRRLAEYLREKPRFRDLITPEYINLLFKSAPLHDIGKVGVPDKILRKPGPLDDDEWEEMKRHVVYGRDALLRAEAALGSTSFLKLAKEVVSTHHERWDGTGYPEGLVGDDIPLSGRLMAIADVYDALVNKRAYKEAFPPSEAISMIRQGKGAHFDPDLVDALIVLQEEFREIAVRFSDSPV